MKKIFVLIFLPLIFFSCSLDSFLFEPEIEKYSFSNEIIPANNRNLIKLKISDKTIYALQVGTTNTNNYILYFHGNYRNLNHYYKWIEIYYEMGYNSFTIDYEGYGQSEGTCSEEALFRDADSAYNYVTKNLKWPEKKIIIYGYSLGSIPAVYLSTKHKVKMLFLEAPIGNADSLVKTRTPLDIPGEFVTISDYNNIERIKNSKNGLAIIQGTEDQTVPYKYNGMKIYENAPEPKFCKWLDGVGHGNFPGDYGRENYKTLLQTFFNKF